MPAPAVGPWVGVLAGRETRERCPAIPTGAPCEHPHRGEGGVFFGARNVRGVCRTGRGGAMAAPPVGPWLAFHVGAGCAEIDAGAPWGHPHVDLRWSSAWEAGCTRGVRHNRRGCEKDEEVDGGERERMRVDEMERRAAAESKRGAIAREGRETNKMAWMGRERMGRRKETRGAARSNRRLKAQ